MAAIEVCGLRKSYGGKLAVDDLSFTVRPGVVTGFLGPNGAGKSSTMRVILGLDHPDSGTATIGGRPYAQWPRPLSVAGALLDAGSVHPSRSAFHHLLFLAQTQGIARRRVDEVIDMVGLNAVARKRAGGFSLGMRQRLGIAAALLGDPEVLILDEPVNGLDPEGVLWIRTLLQNLAAQGRTVFVSSHLMSEMAVTAEHIVVIGRGRLIADRPTRTFVDGHAPGVLVRSPDADALRQALVAAGATVDAAPEGLLVEGMDGRRVGEIAAAHRLVLEEVRARTASLEEVFMDLTRDSVEYGGTA